MVFYSSRGIDFRRGKLKDGYQTDRRRLTRKVNPSAQA